MADETAAPTQAPAETAAPETPAAGAAPKAAGGFRRFLLLAAGIAAAAGGAGYWASLLSGWRGTPKEAAAEVPTAEEPGAPGDVFNYKDLDAVTVNLDEPRLARYVCVQLTLAIHANDFEEASPVIDEKVPILRDWLTVYMASCPLNDVRGAANLNRIRREILDAFNRELWPDQKPRISHILFKEFAVK
ncbi:MAG: flagellar basal body-associated FliL family protein [Planctomycetes bacterium]|nr:flagellar basal body-associated FliL family protein [Planctomycetota bacterium]